MFNLNLNRENLGTILDNIQVVLSYLIKLSLVISACIDVFLGRWMLLFLNLLALFLVFLPSLFEKNYRINLPIELEFLFAFFIYGSIFLGESFDYYHRFWWWDVMLHSLSSIILGYAGFIILFVLASKKLIEKRPFLIVLFSFCFAVALGAIWEIFEFFMDTTFGLNMLKEGLVDTMWDLITDCIGALLVSTFGYFYMKYSGGWIFKDWIANFIESNPRLFKQ